MIRSYGLFVVYGASGCGKSHVLDMIIKICPEASVHQKLTTRKPRENEDPENCRDLKFVNNIDPDECEVVYGKFSAHYGVRRELLERAYREKESHFVIINDTQAIRKLKQSHPETIAIYMYTDSRDVSRNLQKREGVSMKERRRRIRDSYQEFVHNNVLFDFIVVNFWEVDNAIRQLEQILANHYRLAAGSLLR